jgi:hypothetical protein
MKLHNLERAQEIEFNQWLTKELELTQYQREVLHNKELIRFSCFYLYKKADKVGTNILWRLSIVPFIIYFILLGCFIPIYFIITGKWGYGRKFMDKFHSVWVRKIGFL